MQCFSVVLWFSVCQDVAGSKLACADIFSSAFLVFCKFSGDPIIACLKLVKLPFI